MDDQLNTDLSNQNIKPPKTLLWAILAVVITAIVVGGVVYSWQKAVIKKQETNLKQQLSETQKQLDIARNHLPPVTASLPSSVSTQNQKSKPANWSEFSEPSLPISFSYPQEWGTPDIQRDSDTAQSTFLLNIKPNITASSFNIEIAKYDSGANRYYDPCLRGSCGKIDLLKQKQEVDTGSSTVTPRPGDPVVIKKKIMIAGLPALAYDSYIPPAGPVSREYRFFTSTHKIEIHALYSIFDIHGINPIDGFVAVAQEFKENFVNGTKIDIDAVMQKHPNQEMINFYNTVQSIVESVKLK